MLEGKTKSGFAFRVDENNINNMEYLDLLAEADTNVTVLGKIILMLLGAEQKRALYDHVRTKDGRVPIDAIETELNEIMGANDETKNL